MFTLLLAEAFLIDDMKIEAEKSFIFTQKVIYKKI